MGRKKRKQARKQKPFLTDKEAHILAILLVKALNKLPKKEKFCNQTFVTEKKERGCFSTGGFYEDICLCKYCFAKKYCDKNNYPPKHIINSKEWRVSNEKT